MSIIYDALQKVQKNITEETTSSLQPQTPKEASHLKPKTGPILIYIFVVCLGFALGNFAYNFFMHPKNTIPVKTEIVSQPKPAPLPPAVNQSATAAPSQDSTTSANPVPPPPEPPTFVLNGVFFEQGEGFALINNKILRVGDEIEHAKVKEIRISEVELELEGKTIKLLSPS